MGLGVQEYEATQLDPSRQETDLYGEFEVPSGRGPNS